LVQKPTFNEGLDEFRFIVAHSLTTGGRITFGGN
jgi:hypothetical protein